MQTETQTFDAWAIVELFGHTKIAGKCSEQNIAGTNMLRVDVPETKAQPPFSRLFGSSAIYSINPVDEITARTMAESFQKQPLDSWDSEKLFNKQLALREERKMLESEVHHERNREYYEEDDGNNSIF